MRRKNETGSIDGMSADKRFASHCWTQKRSLCALLILFVGLFVGQTVLTLPLKRFALSCLPKPMRTDNALRISH